MCRQMAIRWKLATTVPDTVSIAGEHSLKQNDNLRSGMSGTDIDITGEQLILKVGLKMCFHSVNC